MDALTVEFAVPEQLSWAMVGLIFGDDDGSMVTGIRRDIDDLCRWDDDGGYNLAPNGQG